MTEIAQHSRYFSTRGVISLIAITLSAALVSAIGQHSLNRLTIVADAENQRAIQLQAQINSLQGVDQKSKDAQAARDELVRLMRPVLLSRTLAEVINWLPGDAVVDQFSARSIETGATRFNLLLRTQQTVAQLKALPPANYFSSADLTSTENASIQFTGTAGGVTNEVGRNPR